MGGQEEEEARSPRFVANAAELANRSNAFAKEDRTAGAAERPGATTATMVGR